ncbi:MAG: hypothetical protein Q9209_001926 [Squamulea sp. 1 TL-2023]
MSGKATAGFADLRAKFENKTDTSPPSQGRSPAGQENVKGSGRKIRTSFVSVERSGQMGPSIDQRESMGSNEDQTSGIEGVNEPKAGMNSEGTEVPKINGTAAASGKQEEREESRVEEAESDAVDGIGNGTLELDEATKTDAINPDKPATAEEDDAPSMLPSDPKDKDAVSGGAALAPKGDSLGALLKGSAFEEPSNLSSPKRSPKKATAPSNPSTPVKKNRQPPKSTPAKAVGTPNINGSPKAKATASRPSTVNKPKALSAAKPDEMSPSTAEDSTTPTDEPTAISPTTSKSPAKHPLGKSASPRQHTQKQSIRPEDTPKSAEKERKRPTIQKASRLSTSTKSAQSTGQAVNKPNGTAAAVVPKKSGPNSPNTTKPKPRSPTRPVRLPGAATASTAASSAKTGSTVPPRPESRAGVSNPAKSSTLIKPTGTRGLSKPTAANIRTKAPRSSLPASTIEQKPKPKPRTSIASAKAPGNDFLSRMMRPTQSSASKTHEKVEQKTPPKKRISSRPKRISDENGSGEQTESKTTEADTKPKQQGAEQDEPAATHVDSATDQENAALGSTEKASIENAAEPGVGNLTPREDITAAA